MHLDLSSNHFGFYDVFYGKGEEHIKHRNHYSGSWFAAHGQDHGSRNDDYQTDTGDWKAGDNCHDTTPKNGGVEAENGKDCPDNDTLNKSTNDGPLEDGIGGFFKFGKQESIFMVGEWRKADEKRHKLFLVDEQKEDDQNHHAEEGKGFQDVGCPGACLVVEKEATGLDERGQGVSELCRFKIQAKSLQIGLGLDCCWAFLEEGVYFDSDPGVSSPLIEA